MKAKPPRLKAARGELRQAYAWHLREPFENRFDHSHWWKQQTDIEPAAALYELARRHPVVGVAKLDLLEVEFPDSLFCLCQIGEQSWPKLGNRERDFWLWSCGNIKGVDRRSPQEQCISITELALIRIGWRRALRKYGSIPLRRADPLIAKDMAMHPPSAAKLGAAVARVAVESYGNGYLLLAIAPDLAIEDAQALMAAEYRQHRRLNQPPKQRARCENWLDVVSEFEDEELSHGKRKSQVFTRYRRVMDSVHFT